MRAPVYLVFAAAFSVCAGAAEEPAFYGGRQLRPLDVPVDQETVRYLLPKLAAKYRPNADWTDVADPRFYLLTETESNDVDGQVDRNNIRNKRYNYEKRRSRPERYAGSDTVLSINAPIKTLQKLYYQERLRQRLAKNRDFLNNDLVDTQ